MTPTPETLVDRIANGIAVLGEENARLKARIEALENLLGEALLLRAEGTMGGGGFAVSYVTWQERLNDWIGRSQAALAGEEKP